MTMDKNRKDIAVPPPIPDKLLDLIYGFRASKTLFAACDLGIFDILHDSETPQLAEDIAAKIKADADATTRFMDALVGLELLQKIKRGQSGLYSNTKMASQFLTKSSPDSVGGYIGHSNKIIYHLFGNLETAVKEGSNQWMNTFGLTSEDVWKSMYSTDEAKLRFLETLHSTSRNSCHAVAKAFDLSKFHSCCDLGGGTGAMAYTLCQYYPDMKITVCDIQSVVDSAHHFQPSLDDCPNQANVSFVVGDFFQPDLPKAELYVLSRIIHDWLPDKVDKILSNVFDCLPSDVMVNRRADACVEKPISESAISHSSNKILLHLDWFLLFNQRKNRFRWIDGSVDKLEQFLDARFAKGNEDGDSTSGMLKISNNSSCVVLKLPYATFIFYPTTKLLQIQGRACGDIRKFLEDIAKNVVAAQPSNHDNKSEDSAESALLASDFSPENITFDHESSPEIRGFQPLNEDSEEEELVLAMWILLKGTFIIIIVVNAKLLEKVESLQTNVLLLQNQINSFTRNPSPGISGIGDYKKKLCDSSTKLDLSKSKNHQCADEMGIANEEKQCLLTSLRLLSKKSKESTNNGTYT